MKKKITIVAILLLAVLIMCVGCSSESKLNGKYKGSGVFSNVTYTFDGDGKVTIKVGSLSVNATYTVSGSTVTIVSAGEASTGTIGDDTITITEEGVSMVLTKQ